MGNINILENYALKPLNTFGLDVKASYFVAIHSVEELRTVLADPIYGQLPRLVLGGGSNLLFTKDFEGIIIKMDIRGIEKVKENDQHVWLKVGAGENWHQFVLYCIEHNYAGLENLSLIPGTVGAAPMQNIGAYGVEIKDVFEVLEAVKIEDGSVRTFTNEECQFGYRYSIFKQEAKDQYIIVSATFRLNKQPVFNTSYGAIQETLEKFQVKDLSIKAVSDAVIHIRQSKLPDPEKIGNAGSFFKNPSIEADLFAQLKEAYPTIPGYEQEDGWVKVPAGWLIEQCGWKGKTVGNAGVHARQALVLVNRGNAQGEEIWQLAKAVQASVNEKFGIVLSPEVNIV
jgi:UDP-N-acetylmuramate dehydrogenase